MRTPLWLSALFGLCLAAQPAFAHHPFAAEFDHNKPVTLNGAITKVEWTNPHAYVYLDVKDDQGKMANWKVELAAPDSLTKHGWTNDMLKIGHQVTLQGWRAKDGTNFASAESMTMPDGKKLSAMSSYFSPHATAQGAEPKERHEVGTSGKLPKTASPLPLIGLLGLLSLLSGIGMRTGRA